MFILQTTVPGSGTPTKTPPATPPGPPVVVEDDPLADALRPAPAGPSRPHVTTTTDDPLKKALEGDNFVSSSTTTPTSPGPTTPSGSLGDMTRRGLTTTTQTILLAQGTAKLSEALAAAKSSGWFMNILKWGFGTSRLAKWTSGIANWASKAAPWLNCLRTTSTFGGRVIPIAGIVLSAIDVGIDYISAACADKGSDVIGKALEGASGVTPEQIRRAQQLADADLTNSENFARLRQHLESIGLTYEATSLATRARQAQETRSQAFTDANWNLGLTVGGGLAGAGVACGLIALGVCTGPVGWTILGAVALGMAVGGLVNMIRKGGVLSSIGNFFKGFFTGR